VEGGGGRWREVEGGKEVEEEDEVVGRYPFELHAQVTLAEIGSKIHLSEHPPLLVAHKSTAEKKSEKIRESEICGVFV
jgi:hypothetical protein